MFAIAILINWNLINLIGEADGDNDGGQDAKVPPRQPVAYSARISNSVHLSDLRFMVFILMALQQIDISTVWYSRKIAELCHSETCYHSSCTL